MNSVQSGKRPAMPSNCKGFGREGETHYRTQVTVTQTRAPVPPDLQRGVRCQNGLIPGERGSGFEDTGEKGKGMEGLVMASCRYYIVTRAIPSCAQATARRDG